MPDIKDAQIFIEGTLKFDGIMNVSFTEFKETETMWMLSVPYDIGALDFVFKTIMDNAKQDFMINTLW